RDLLTEYGWPEPIVADSGNGAHAIYRVDEPNNAETTALFQRGLEALDSLFSDDAVVIDRTTYNAARIWKLYGTMARKGDNLPERPHRLARILDAPDEPGIVTRQQLGQIAALLPEPEPPPGANSHRHSGELFDLERFITEHGISIKKRAPWGNGHERLIL